MSVSTDRRKRCFRFPPHLRFEGDKWTLQFIDDLTGYGFYHTYLAPQAFAGKAFSLEEAIAYAEERPIKRLPPDKLIEILDRLGTSEPWASIEADMEKHLIHTEELENAST